MPITASQITTFQRCQEEYRLAYRRRLRAIPSGAMQFGTAIHEALAIHYLGGSHVEVMQALSANLTDEGDLGKARAMVAGYLRHYEHSGIKALEVEKEFQFGRYSGKIDAIVEVDGAKWVLEHKTASNADDNYWRKLLWDHQIQIYMGGAASLEHECEGVLYDVLVKPRLRKTQKESTGDFMRRCAAHIRKDMGEFYQMRRVFPKSDFTLLEKLADDMDQVRADEPAMRSVGGCIRYNKPCPFMLLCSGEQSENEFEKKEKENDELG